MKPRQNFTKLLVDECGWSWEDVASRLHASYNSVKNWYFGRTKPIRVHEERLAELYRETSKKEKEHGKRKKVEGVRD